MEQFVILKGWNGDLVFEIVDVIPLGYSIWNIGNNMKRGYLPLCRQLKNQRFPGSRDIDPNTLTCIKCTGALTIMKAVKEYQYLTR